jgi:hypothetical protein
MYNLDASRFRPNLKRTADREGPDFYPTPRWCTRALIAHEEFRGTILEPACGDGAMSRVLLKESGCSVLSSDLYPRGYGRGGVDFLTAPFPGGVDNVVTNPPYNSAEGFLWRALGLARRKVALLLRLAFLEGVNRGRTIYARAPPTRVWVFSERPTFYPAGAEVAGSGTQAYGWFVWDKLAANPVSYELRWLRPGFKEKGT